MRFKLFILVALAVILGISQPALAITGDGQPDNGEHPYVGLLVFYDASGVPQWRCTGTLISPTIVLTAAHCTELEQTAQIWFNEVVDASTGYPYTGGIMGQAYASPWWRGGLYLPNSGDVGVVVLNTPVNLPYYPSLAPVGYLDDLASKRGQQDVNFEVVGYGRQSVKPRPSALRIRLKGMTQLITLNSALTDGYNIALTNNKGNGTGGSGTCFGDSGGPTFSIENGIHYIVAVTSFGMNDNCAGTGYGYRVDRAEVQSWVLNPN